MEFGYWRDSHFCIASQVYIHTKEHLKMPEAKQDTHLYRSIKSVNAGAAAFHSLLFIWQNEDLKTWNIALNYSLILFTKGETVNLTLKDFKHISKGFMKIALFIKTLFPPFVH